MQLSWTIPENGILDLLAAVRVVVSQNDNAHFVIVGDGPFRGEYTNKAIELGLREHVTWTGVLEDLFTARAYDGAEGDGLS